MLPALILSAGVGARLDPLTRIVAKPVVPLAGRTLVERAIGWLTRAGVTDVVVNLHHRPETVAAVLGDGASLGVRLRYSWEPVLLGSAGGPRHALPLLDADTFLIVNGDTLVDVDLPAMIAAHARRGADVTVAVIPNPRPDHYNGMELDAEDRVTGFVLKGEGRPSWHFVGVQVARASVFAPLADNVPAETVTGVYRSLVATRPGALRGFRAQTTFLDIGTPRDYLDAALQLAAPATVAIEPGASIDPGARAARSVLWGGAHVAAGAHLDRAIVTSGVSVPPGFRAHDAILLPARYARPDDGFEDHDEFVVAAID
ncbi:MAG TPA: sugar phosphate nucleotidyltransferase [Vicinamibacterales bacterium]|nr:sugar phosphate nucleotidyltransferase [Vicinamibacterales bacterium]